MLHLACRLRLCAGMRRIGTKRRIMERKRDCLRRMFGNRVFPIQHHGKDCIKKIRSNNSACIQCSFCRIGSYSDCGYSADGRIDWKKCQFVDLYFTARNGRDPVSVLFLHNRTKENGCIEPVTAAAVSALFLKELLGILQVIGIGLIVGSIVLLQIKDENR